MKKQTSITLVLTSFVLMSVTYYLMRYVVGNKTVAFYALATIFTISAVLLLYISYKELLRRLGKGAPVKEDYAVLYGLENSRVSGEVEFYFTLEQPRQLTFMLLNSALEELEVLADQQFGQGGHILRYDTGKLEDGIYFYCLKSDNQKTMKRMVVQHDKLTV